MLPAIADLEVAPNGALWVLRTGLHGDPRKIDVFDPGGEYLGTLARDAPFPVAFLPDGRLLTLERDEMDIERIIVCRVGGQ